MGTKSALLIHKESPEETKMNLRTEMLLFCPVCGEPLVEQVLRGEDIVRSCGPQRFTHFAILVGHVEGGKRRYYRYVDLTVTGDMEEEKPKNIC